MSKNKWLIVLTLGTVAFVAIAVIAFAVWFFFLGNLGVVGLILPVYTHDQGPSIHPGYRRSTVTSGTSVYVNDYEEYALQLIEVEPTHAVGRSPFGGGKVCSILGQDPTAYLAVDVGSEMPAYAVFRNSQLPPFDWRKATFQKMVFATDLGPAAHKQSTDPALIEDVVRTLQNGAPTPPALPASGTTTNLYAVQLFCDQLPGIIFCPAVYTDPAGTVYLAESYGIQSANSTQWIQARWIKASPQFTNWTQTR